jgi:hypothetical protein
MPANGTPVDASPVRGLQRHDTSALTVTGGEALQSGADVGHDQAGVPLQRFTQLVERLGHLLPQHGRLVRPVRLLQSGQDGGQRLAEGRPEACDVFRRNTATGGAPHDGVVEQFAQALESGSHDQAVARRDVGALLAHVTLTL